MNILVVEDEVLITDFLRRGLEAEGYAIDTAGRGEDALACLRERPPDRVILKVMLPGMDGFEVLGAIRATDPDLPVIMLTARSDVADRVRGLDLGATDYLGNRSRSPSFWRGSGPAPGARRRTAGRPLALGRAGDADLLAARRTSTAAA